MNSLAQASSAYLRSAMHQPIQWHEWGEEAFAAAQRDNKPILLDIGAVWCHWCHVMDRESYESSEVAGIINREFIAVKVDRDERPDVDSRYQLAVSAISGTGGWPLTVFLTPDGRPFYGGTYFPPVDQWGRPSFKKILLAIADAYKERRDEVLKSAEEAMNVLSNAENFSHHHREFSPRLVGIMVQSALPIFDEKHGGFGSAPKFPHPAAIDLLLDWYARTGEERVATVITTTLTKMARGGVYDQLAGGFHRYSVDEHWTVPHFEKMSYDNSELLKNYVHAYQVFGYEFYAHVARDIIRWMDEWLSDREHGGFYASQDADINLDDDGDYFTWTVEDAKAVLTEEEFKAIALHYDIEPVGEMQHDPTKNVLWVRALPEEVASRLGIDQSQALDLLASAKTKLYAARLQRPTPFVDKTVYVSWNAMCVSAYLQAAQVLGLDDARKFALRSLDRILAEAWSEERGMSHVIAYADPKANKRFVAGLLDDYAFTATGVSGCLRSHGRDELLHLCAPYCRQDESPLRRCGGRRLLRHGSVARREAATRRAVGPAEAVPGCADTRGKSRRSDRTFAPACLHERSKISREGRGNHLGLRRCCRAIRNLRWDLWDRGDLAVAAAYASRSRRRRRKGCGTVEGSDRSIRGQ